MTDIEKLITLRGKLVARRRSLVASLQKATRRRTVPLS
jgi:hypothetical protein